MRREFTFTFDSGKTLRMLGWFALLMAIWTFFRLLADALWPEQKFLLGWIAACVASPALRHLGEWK